MTTHWYKFYTVSEGKRSTGKKMGQELCRNITISNPSDVAHNHYFWWKHFVRATGHHQSTMSLTHYQPLGGEIETAHNDKEHRKRPPPKEWSQNEACKKCIESLTVADNCATSGRVWKLLNAWRLQANAFRRHLRGRFWSVQEEYSWQWNFTNEVCSLQSSCEWVSEWVSSFLTAHQHN